MKSHHAALIFRYDIHYNLTSTMRPSFFHHLHPPTIPAEQARLRYTLGAGGISIFLVLVVILTGMLEMFYYLPAVDGAAQSVQTITFLVPFGWLVRNLHYWSAQLLVVAVGVHGLRVVLTGAYARPRRFNYLLGLFLFAACLLLDFTGYLLRWDTGVHWALVTGTNLVKTIPQAGSWLYNWLLGGDQPGQAALVRFYAWHVFGLSTVLVAVGAWHIFRVRRDGGIAVPPVELRTGRPRITRFELARREAQAMLWASAVLIVVAVVFPAPLAAPLTASPEGVLAEARAPWFFLWVQQLLKLGNPFLFGVLVPLLAFCLMIYVAWLPPQPAELGRWLPRSGRPAQLLAGSLAVFVLALTLWAVLRR